MAENLQVTGIKLDTRDLRRGASRAEREFRKLERRAGKLEREVEGTSRSFGKLGAAAGAAVAAIGGFVALQRVGRFVFQTNKQFQQLEARLTSVTGSASDAERAFDLIADFASDTPFQIQNLTEAFTTLQLRGLDPTRGMLEDLGNFAAAFGADITDMVTAITRAAEGGTERLREGFGIPIEKMGDRIAVTFRGTRRVVDAEVGALIGLFRELSQENFASAMSRQMDTLVGSISNLQDTAALAAKRVGEEGLNAAIQDLAGTLEDAISLNGEFAETLGRTMANGVRVADGALQLLVEHTEEIVAAMKVLTGIAVGRGLLALGSRLASAATAAGGLRAALIGIGGGPIGIVASLAGIIGVELVSNLVSARSETERLVDELERLSGAAIAEGPEAIRSRLGNLRARESRLTEQGERFARVRNLTRESGTADTGFGRNAQANLERNRAKLAEVRQEISRLEQALSRQEETQTRVTTTTREQSDAVEELIAGLREERDALLFSERELLTRQLAQEGATDAEIERALAIFDTVEALEAEEEAQEKAAEAAERRMEILDRQREQVRNELARIEENARRQAETFASNLQLAQLQEEMRRIEEFSNRMGEAFTTMAEDVAFQSENILDAVQSMVEGILREIARLTLAQTVGKALGGLVSSALGGGIPAAPGPIDAPQAPNLPGFQHGGSFKVGGTGGPDSQLVAFRASPGERVSIMPEKGGGGGGSGGQVQVFNENNFAPMMVDQASGRAFLERHAADIATIIARASESDNYRAALQRGSGV